MAAQALFAERAPHQEDEALLEAACELEGHPDNIIPAFYGGLCISLKNGKGAQFLHINVPRDLVAVVCFPDFELSTEKARAVLPKMISREDAVSTAARVALFIGAMEHKRYDLFNAAMQDVLHQPYRRPLVPGMKRVIDAAVKAGALGAALSGAGPSILALARRSPRTAVIGRAMQKSFFAVGVESRYQVLEIDRHGASAKVIK